MSDRIVVAVVPDLMDRSRLAAPGVELRFVGAGRLAEAAAAPDVTLVVVDLARPGVLEAVAALPAGGPPVIGFGPHVEGEVLAAATGAGCTTVLPRSRFFARWPEL